MPLTAATLVTPQGDPLPDPAATTAEALGWMRGFPPPPERRVRFDDPAGYGSFPRNRWAFSHMRELAPTANVWRGAGAPRPLPAAARPIDPRSVHFEAMGTGEEGDFAAMLWHTYADSVIVLHRGEVVYEAYWGEGRPERPHICYSVTKSFVGILAATLAAEGRLDPNTLVPHYLPEMAGSAYADATLRDVMDMRIGVQYSEVYTDPRAEVHDYARAGGMLPRPAGYAGPGGFYDFLPTLRKQGGHGAGFTYKTVNTEVLAWVLRRVSGLPLAELLSQRIWQPIGAEQDAYFLVDALGTESGGGGLNCTLRDLARFGELMRHGGRVDGAQVLPAAAIAETAAGGSPAAFTAGGYDQLAGWSYRNMWWVTHNPHGACMARGIHGQSLYVDPKAEMVIARFAAHPWASSVGNDPLTLPAFHAMGEALLARD
ncbi:serine hydrolase domain-containing protein [Ottowia sp.]|uniref:serine hydrolase domain-containing protein n=1 Tax=Ottowia sp. TaxID=1898956 RepID=UPI0039E54FCB